MRRGEVSTEELVRFLLGEVTQSEREEIERVLADSRRARDRLDEISAMTDALRRPPAWAESVDLSAAIREKVARGEGVAPQGRARGARRWAIGGAAGALAAAAAVLLVVRAGRQGREEEFRPKGAVEAQADPDRWIGIRVARAAGGGAVEPITPGGALGRGELQVWYTNLGPRPYSHLMVFAVDRGGRVYWLYPAYERAGSDPAAVPIAGGGDVLLPDRIEHEFAAGRLSVCGLFLREPVTVGRMERALGGRPIAGEERLWPGAGQHCFDVEAE